MDNDCKIKLSTIEVGNYIENAVTSWYAILYHERSRVMCVLGIDFASVKTIFLLDF